MLKTASCSVLSVVVAAVCLASCNSGPQRRPHSSDVETSTAPAAASGECDGAPVFEVASLVPSEAQPASSRPEEGSVVAVEGVPQPQMVCTMLACDAACCNNSCGYARECPYSLRVDDKEICLLREDFQCGGTDCSGWCSPFSTQPKHRYRFVGKLEGAKLHVQKFCRLD